MAELMRISIDCSFLAHALIRDQATPDAIAALREVASQHQAFGTLALFLEFPSLLRRSVNQQKLTARSAAEIFEFFARLPIERSPYDDALVRRSWELAIRLDQSDVFDAMGYALAERIGGEFWTCDARFARAAANVRLPGVRLVA